MSKLQYVPYTSDTAEYTALKSGTLDVAAIGVGIPSADLPPKTAGSALPATNPLGSGYNLQPFYSYAIAFGEYNFQNPKYGPVFRQLYFRSGPGLPDRPGGDGQGGLRGIRLPDNRPGAA